MLVYLNTEISTIQYIFAKYYLKILNGSVIYNPLFKPSGCKWQGLPFKMADPTVLNGLGVKTAVNIYTTKIQYANI